MAGDGRAWDPAVDVSERGRGVAVEQEVNHPYRAADRVQRRLDDCSLTRVSSSRNIPPDRHARPIDATYASGWTALSTNRSTVGERTRQSRASPWPILLLDHRDPPGVFRGKMVDAPAP